MAESQANSSRVHSDRLASMPLHLRNRSNITLFVKHQDPRFSAGLGKVIKSMIKGLQTQKLDLRWPQAEGKEAAFRSEASQPSS